MDDLKKYIGEHRDDFDSMPLPPGSKERFIAKVEKRNRRKRLGRIFFAGITSAAAALAVIAMLKYETDENLNVARMMQRMTECETEILSIVERYCPQETEATCNTIRAITAEAIPLASLLPEELPAKERIRILKEYYGQKIEALERMKSIYIEINNVL